MINCFGHQSDGKAVTLTLFHIIIEKLVGDLSGAYSRRINIQHRLVYQVLAEERVVKVIRMWTHYE
jgi:Txe/YoeB family toxin of toxin-antitoxin system